MSTTTTSPNGAVPFTRDEPADVHPTADDPGSRTPRMTIGSEVGDLELVLEAVCHNAVALSCDAARPPSRLRVVAGDIVVELTWFDGDQAGAVGLDGGSAAAPIGRSTTAAGVPAPRSHGAPGRAGSARGAAGAPGESTDAPGPAAADAGAGAGAPGDPSLTYLTAPSVGVFYHAPEPGAPAFVRVGDTVAARQQVGILEVMKLMIPIEAATAGRIVEVCRTDATSVEFGEPLFALAPVSAA